MKTKIDLCLIDAYGVIINKETGIIWTNQTGGECCNHPEIEGFFVPYITDLSHKLCCGPFDDKFKEKICDEIDQEFLENSDPFIVDRERWSICQEAWVPIIVIACHKDSIHSPWQTDVFNNLIGAKGILTYPNCD